MNPETQQHNEKVDTAGRDLPNPVIAHLREHGGACPVCDYDLRGLSEPRCPECGAAIELRIGSSDLKLGYWLTSVIAVTLPLGLFFSLFVVHAVYAVTRSWFAGPEMRRWLLTEIALSIGYGGLLLLLVLKRRTFWRRRRPVQRTLMLLVLIGSWLSAGLSMWFLASTS